MSSWVLADPSNSTNGLFLCRFFWWSNQLCDVMRGKHTEEVDKILKVESDDSGGQMVELIQAISQGPMENKPEEN